MIIKTKKLGRVFDYTYVAPDFSGVSEAAALARMAHLRQTDKAGNAYFSHVERVARGAYFNVTTSLNTNYAFFLDQLYDFNAIQIVGYLHDIIEDTFITFGDLKRLGFSDQVLDGVAAVTKGSALARKLDETFADSVEDYRITLAVLERIFRYDDTTLFDLERETYHQFVTRAAKHDIGVFVKLADVQDHLYHDSGYVLSDSMRKRYEAAEGTLKRYVQARGYADHA